MNQTTKSTNNGWVRMPGSDKMKSYRLLAALIVAAWLVVVIFLWSLHGAVLNWDEVDYLNAAEAGLWANVFDVGSLAPRDFLRLAVAKRAGRKQELPPNYVEERDPLILRHFHPPFVTYLTSTAISLSGSANERLVRAPQLLGSLALVCAMLFAYLSIANKPGWPGVLAVVLFAIGLGYFGFYLLSCHGWLAVWTTVTAALFTRWLSDGRTIVGILTCAGLALAIITLEMSAVVWAGLVLSLIIWKPYVDRSESGSTRRSAIFARVRYMIVGTLLTSLFVVCFWPGSVVKMSIIKTPLVLFYRSSLGQDFERSATPFLITLPLICLIAPSCAWLFYRRLESIRQWGPFLILGTLYWLVLVVVAPFALNPTYFVPAFAPLACLIGLAVDETIGDGKARHVSATVLIVVAASVMTSMWASGLPILPRPSARDDSDFHWLADNLRGRQTLADGAHIYQHYLGDDYQIEPISLSADETKILMRERGEYRVVSPEEIAGKILVIFKRRTRFIQNEGTTVHTMPAGCQRFDLTTIRVYDCTRVSTQSSNEPKK